MKDNSKIYVLSTGRCGSTFISKLFKEISGGNIIPHQVKNARRVNILGNMVLSNIIPPIFLNSVLRIDKTDNLPDNSADPLFSIGLTEYIKNFKTSNNYKIVHLVRDPRDFTRSFISWKQRKLSGVIAHHFTPFWQPSPLFIEKKILKRLAMTKFEHFCWIWNYKNNYFERYFSNDSYYRIRLEDLVSEKKDNKYLKELLEFIELTGNTKSIELSDPINKSKIKKISKWQDWDSITAKNLDHYCGRLMRKYGYGNELDWELLIKN